MNKNKLEKINIIVIDWGIMQCGENRKIKQRFDSKYIETKMELNLNIKNYEYAEQDQIDYFYIK